MHMLRATIAPPMFYIPVLRYVVRIMQTLHLLHKQTSAEQRESKSY